MDSNKINIHPAFLAAGFVAIMVMLFVTTSHHRMASDIMTNHKVWSPTTEKPCGQYKACISVQVETVNNSTGKLETHTFRYDATAKGLMNRDVRMAIVSQMSDNYSNWDTTLLSATWSDDK